MRSPIQIFVAAAVMLATATVAAQVYKWVDKDGKVQFTDTPPPPGATKAEAKKVIDAPASVTTTSAAPAKTTAERNKESDKRRKDEAEKGKKADEDQKAAAIDDENCKAARGLLRELETGRPMTKTDEGGNRYYLSDEQRQAEVARARKSEAAFCKNS